MKKRIKITIIGLFLVGVIINIYAQSYFFYVQFSDKNDTPYSLDNPSEFLTTRALERRAFFNIPVDSTDLPVNAAYLQQIENLGVRVHATTRWLNGATILMSDSTVMEQVRALPFINYSQFTGLNHVPGLLPAPQRVKSSLTAELDYGAANAQIEQLQGKVLHQDGYSGSGMHIAVIDAGFQNVDINVAFETMRNEGRLIGTKDFVNPESDIFREHYHGSNVLSAMAGKLQNPAFTGTAPDASYLLLRTESDPGEYLCEPDFWISAIEYADSLGVDVATTSLGYTQFDIESMNYDYSELNGHTIRASIAGNMAFEKGILVFNSAGNEGNKAWKYISVPADAQGVIAVGAVDALGQAATFSSFGPTPDGRIKPELSVRGSAAALVFPFGNVSTSSGTSYSSPILAGMGACFLQAAKSLAPSVGLDEIRQMMYQSGSLYDNPHDQLGYGIPNFATAYNSLLTTSIAQNTVYVGAGQSAKLLIQDAATPHYYHLPTGEKSGSLTLYSLQGTLLFQTKIEGQSVIELPLLPTGVYIIKTEN